MSSRWVTRVLLVSAVLMLVLPAVAGAQTARLEGMQLRSDYVKDASNIYPYPNQLPLVGNYVYGELGNALVNPNTGSPLTLDRGVGTVLNNLWDGRAGAWSVHLREETPAIGRGDAFSQPTPGVLGGDFNQHTHQSFELMWGQQFGTTTLGLKLNRSQSKATVEQPGITTTFAFDLSADSLSRNIMGYGAGVGFELNPETALDVSFLLESRTYENGVEPLGARSENDGTTTYQVNARLNWEYQPNWIIVPVFKLYSYDFSTMHTTAAGSGSFDNKLTGWEAGLAGNWTVGANDLFVLGVTFAQNKLDQQSDIVGLAGAIGLDPTMEVTETHLPQVFAALETNVNPWLALRFGATKGAFYNVKIDGTDAGTATTVKIYESPFEMSIGAGVKLGTLQLDAVLNNVFPHTLGWIGSGIPGVYFPKVTATYAF